MKSILRFFLALSLLILLGCAGTQSLTTEGKPIPFKVNTIIIDDNKSINDSYTSFAQHLLQYGYSIEYSDEKLHCLKTAFKNTSKKGTDISADLSISAAFIENGVNTRIIVRGTAKQGYVLKGGVNLGIIEVTHFGQAGSLVRVAWNELLSIAQYYSTQLSFEIR